MAIETDKLSKNMVVSSDVAPTGIAGLLWKDTSGDNLELNQYNANTSSWELMIARGPDTPDYPVEGSLWRDTSNKELKQYDGDIWGGVGNIIDGKTIRENKEGEIEFTLPTIHKFQDFEDDLEDWSADGFQSGDANSTDSSIEDGYIWLWCEDTGDGAWASHSKVTGENLHLDITPFEGGYIYVWFEVSEFTGDDNDVNIHLFNESGDVIMSENVDIDSEGEYLKKIENPSFEVIEKYQVYLDSLNVDTELEITEVGFLILRDFYAENAIDVFNIVYNPIGERNEL